MSKSRIPAPKAQFVDSNGAPLASGKLYCYAAGTSTPLDTYTDQAGGTPNANPIILDSRGECNLWCSAASYKFVLKTSADATIWTVDNVDNANATLTALAASGGSALVGYIQSGTAPSATTVQAKLRKYPLVSEYGAVGDGTTLDTTAFTNAQAAHSFIEVDEGFNCKVGAGLNYYQFFGKGTVFEAGRKWSLAPYPQTGAIIKGYIAKTSGNYESAVAASFTVNSGATQLVTNTQVTGTTASGLATTSNTERAAVAAYASAYPTTPVAITSGSVFTATSVADTSISTSNTAPGMWIDIYAGAVGGNPSHTGQVQSVSGTTATVDGWYAFGTGVGGTPANGKLGLINFNTKIWGMNIVTNAGAATPATQSAGMEINVSTGGTVGTPTASPLSGTWGVDVYMPQYQYADLAFQARGLRNISFYSNNAGGAGLYGFYSKGDARGVYVADATVNNIEVIVSSNPKFFVNATGETHIVAPVWDGTSSPASGAAGTAGQVVFDATYGYYCVSSGVWKRWALTGGY